MWTVEGKRVAGMADINSGAFILTSMAKVAHVTASQPRWLVSS